MTRPISLPAIPATPSARRSEPLRADTEPSAPPADMPHAERLARASQRPRTAGTAPGDAGGPPPWPRATVEPPQRLAKPPRSTAEHAGADFAPSASTHGSAAHDLAHPHASTRMQDRSPPPDKLPQTAAPIAPDDLPRSSDTAELPAVDLELASSRLRARATPVRDIAPSEQIRTLVYAPEPSRAQWIERELSHAPITIQVGRRVRTVVAALVRDPPPRPDILVVDFDAVSPAELLELHAVRQEGWFGRLIALGSVSPELCTTLGIDHVLQEPLVRDSLLDCVAGTRHAAVTTACPVIPRWNDHS
jgi:hypothetical protein